MTARDPDGRNQLGSLPPKQEARCADGSAVFACLRSIAGQDAPFLVTATRPLAVVACEALPAADALLVRGGSLLAVQRDCERVHSIPFAG